MFFCALTTMTHLDKREELILWTNFFCEAKLNSWEETALKTDFGQKKIVCLKNLYFTILYLYKYRVYAHIISGLFKFPFPALNMLPKLNLNMFSETLEHFTWHKKRPLFMSILLLYTVNWR